LAACRRKEGKTATEKEGDGTCRLIWKWGAFQRGEGKRKAKGQSLNEADEDRIKFRRSAKENRRHAGRGYFQKGGAEKNLGSGKVFFGGEDFRGIRIKRRAEVIVLEGVSRI